VGLVKYLILIKVLGFIEVKTTALEE